MRNAKLACQILEKVARAKQALEAHNTDVFLIQNNAPAESRHLINPRQCRENVMISTPTPQLGIPDELRAVAERRVEHAKGAFADFMRAAQGVVSALEDRVTARQASAHEIGNKAISFAERNVSSAFDFAQKILQAKDFQELEPPVRAEEGSTASTATLWPASVNRCRACRSRSTCQRPGRR